LEIYAPYFLSFSTPSPLFLAVPLQFNAEVWIPLTHPSSMFKMPQQRRRSFIYLAPNASEIPIAVRHIILYSQLLPSLHKADVATRREGPIGAELAEPFTLYAWGCVKLRPPIWGSSYSRILSSLIRFLFLPQSSHIYPELPRTVCARTEQIALYSF
jgi:hypothetical protein